MLPEKLNSMKKSLTTLFVLFLSQIIVSCKSNPILPDPLDAGWKGQKVCAILHEDSKQRVMKCSFAPGVGHEKHYHKPYFGYALSGGKMRLTQESGVRDVELPTGSSFYNQGINWHEVINIGETTVRYIIFEVK